LLERVDLGSAQPAAALAAQRELLEAELALELPPALVAAARAEAAALCAQLTGSRLLARLFALAPHVLARELPILIAGDERRGPTDVVVGSVDLLYRDPANSELVVADYKTDQVRDPAELDERAALHAEQGRTYQLAVQQGLRLATPPRLELWFLRADAVRLPSPGSPPVVGPKSL
jgi:ATP-dependent exoDNAse (exonuclease V) beta subunit